MGKRGRIFAIKLFNSNRIYLIRLGKGDTFETCRIEKLESSNYEKRATVASTTFAVEKNSFIDNIRAAKSLSSKYNKRISLLHKLNQLTIYPRGQWASAETEVWAADPWTSNVSHIRISVCDPFPRAHHCRGYRFPDTCRFHSTLSWPRTF